MAPAVILSLRSLLFSCLAVSSLATLESLVKVYDGVLSESTREKLHLECKSWSNDDVVFVFPLKNPELHSFAEQAMNSILHELYPNTKDPLYYVEYWQRQKWFHIMAHADMDEGLRMEQEEAGRFNEPFAHPEVGQVLYLKLGTRVRGPTCVFNTTFGGELVNGNSDFVVVPAVESRLLRFQGHLLHAVPRPADLWLAPTHENEAEPFEEWGRSVLLFNIWPIPKGHPRACAVTNDTETPVLEGQDQKLTACEPRGQWKEVAVSEFVESADSPGQMIQFPLMGDEKRRGTGEWTVVLEAPQNSRDVFFQEQQPTHMLLRPQPKKKPWFSFMGIEF